MQMTAGRTRTSWQPRLERWNQIHRLECALTMLDRLRVKETLSATGFLLSLRGGMGSVRLSGITSYQRYQPCSELASTANYRSGTLILCHYPIGLSGHM